MQNQQIIILLTRHELSSLRMICFLTIPPLTAPLLCKPPPYDSKHDRLQSISKYSGSETTAEKSSPTVCSENHANDFGIANSVLRSNRLLRCLNYPNRIYKSVADNTSYKTDSSSPKQLRGESTPNPVACRQGIIRVKLQKGKRDM
jgi:hypothetical protein